MIRANPIGVILIRRKEKHFFIIYLFFLSFMGYCIYVSNYLALFFSVYYSQPPALFIVHHYKTAPDCFRY